MKYRIQLGVRPQAQEISTRRGVRMGFGHSFTLWREAYAKMTSVESFRGQLR